MALEIGSASRPYLGQIECGDRCGWWSTPRRIVLALADGLGHGPEAADAAELAMICIGKSHHLPIDLIFAGCNTQLRTTRGVALSVAVVDRDTWSMTLAAVGNIRSVLVTAAKDFRFGSTRGIVGGGYGPLIRETRELAQGDLLALFSDGLDEFAKLRETPDRTRQTPDDYASALLERWSRPDDDAAVLIYRHTG